MTGDVPQHFVLAALLAAALASVAIWSPRRLRVRAASLGLAVLFLPMAWLALGDLLSRPKPVAFEWWHRSQARATVLSSQLREGDGVYLWLQLDGTVEPRAYRLPWDRKMAEELERARAEAERSGSPLMMDLPFERSFDRRERRFYALPQPALPDKPYAGEGGQQRGRIYRRPGEEA